MPAIPNPVAVGDPVRASTTNTLLDAAVNAATGSVTMAVTTANTPVSTTITFPAGLFVNAPTMSATAQTTTPQTCSVGVANVTATGFTLWFSRTTTTPAVVQWIAIEAP